MLKLTLLIYLLLASTFGAYWLAKLDITKKDVNLLDVLRMVIPSILMFWFLFFLYFTSNIKLKK